MKVFEIRDAFGLENLLPGERPKPQPGPGQVCRAIEQHQLQPVVDRVFPFDEAPEALKYMSEGKHFGKVCVEI